MKKWQKRRRRYGLLGVTLLGALLLLLWQPSVSTMSKRQELSKDTPPFLSAAPREKQIPVPALSQYPDLPTGCESTAAAMVLQHYQEPVTPQEFASSWLSCEEFYTVDEQTYGPDPHTAFAGNPFSAHAYGCYAEPIAAAINTHSSACQAQTITGQSLSDLCAAYIDKDRPLLIWATMQMKPSRPGNSWLLPDGSRFTWIAGEHCLVLVGYTETAYLFNDPQVGGMVSYPKEVAEKRFAALGSQAVYIEKR